MSQMTEIKDTALFVELSDREQESVAGGAGLQDLFGPIVFQQTDIDTSAEATTNFNDGSSSTRRTGYKMSQTTFVMPLLSLFGGGGGGRRSRRSRMNMFSLLMSLFS
ncbi:hypothetical protein H6G17_27780 [Chroococcidiopsis sp. FACHB-1243]|uniref:hypothetical protein n=1 Tax=Chroococcidiopsis sp. [FACHB-1243] TaxID=2692781 RepID=UPI00177B317A|nr:hypothetical protein [Chroococcidiopsis sp. [FACHB-1243]]MBD2309263.1 hypothetical protein [Chroococcidiopsis sp. [FACHB-1243]]